MESTNNEANQANESHETKETATTKSGGADNVILVGAKPFMNYVTAVVVQFTTKNADKITIKSRGKFISKAVDVAEVSRRKFLEGKNIECENIKIGSEEFENKEGRKVNVSILEVDLVKK